jgi:hypothetical protein
MRKSLLAVVLVLVVAAEARATCSGTTPNLGLADCTIGTARSVSDPAWINNFKLLDIGVTAPLVITGAGSASPVLSLGTVSATKGGTGQTTFTLGDTLYASGTTTLSKLNGNVTTTRKFREQHGNGTSVTVNAWDTIQAADITSGIIAAARIVNSPSNSRCLRLDSSGLIQVAGADCNSISTFGVGQSLDAANADSTRPNKVGTTAPATCSVGQTFYDSDETPGSNIYACTSTDTWTLEGGGGASGPAKIVFPCQLTAGATDYCGPATTVGNTTAQAALVPMDSTGTFTKLRCASSAAPGSGQTIVYTAQLNGAPEASLTCTQSGGSSFGCGDTGTLAFVAADNVYVEAVSSASSAATTATCTLS